MDPRPPFTGKILRTKADGRSSDAPKSKMKEPTVINREKRVFGTVRNQNAMAKVVAEKPTRKAGILQKPTKHSIDPTETGGTPRKPLQNNNFATAKKKGASLRENVEENKEKLLQQGDVSGAGTKTPSKSSFLVKPQRKSVNFRERVEEIKPKVSPVGDVSGADAQTPLKSPFLIKPVASGTPYQSAERCSNCRFDKLETSSYWLGQIRLAESVGKHFVSAAFFRLASECKAEPIRNMKVELKKYLGRHEHLSDEKEWNDLCVSHGLMKEETTRREDTANIDDNDDQEQEGKQITDQTPNVCGSCE